MARVLLKYLGCVSHVDLGSYLDALRSRSSHWLLVIACHWSFAPRPQVVPTGCAICSSHAHVWHTMLGQLMIGVCQFFTYSKMITKQADDYTTP